MRSHPVLIIQSNSCFTCYCWVLPQDENVCVTSPLDIPYNRDTVIKLHFKAVQVQIQVYKESNTSVYVIIILLFLIKKVLTCEIKWNRFYSDNAHLFNRYCHHCITNISQCNSIYRNRKKLNKIHYKNLEI